MSRNTVGPLVMSGNTGSSLINKHQNTGPTDCLNLTIRIILKLHTAKSKQNSFIVSISKVGKLPTLQSQYFGYT